MKATVEKTAEGQKVDFHFDVESSLIEKIDSLWHIIAAAHRAVNRLGDEFKRLDAEFAAEKQKRKTES